MKIAMLTKHFNFRNGSSRAIHEISVHLVARGHEVHIFCNKKPDAYSGGPILRHVPMLKLGSWAKVLTFNMGCSRMVRQEGFDIIHGHGNTEIQDFLTVRICRKANLVARGLPLSRRDPHLWMEERQFQDARLKRIITLSEMVRKDLHTYYGISLAQIVAIPNGVDLERFHPKVRLSYRGKMRNQYGIKEDEFLVLFVASGNFMNRGLLNLFTALKQVGNLPIRVMIIGTDRLTPFRRIASETGLLSRLLFVPFSDMIECYYAMGDTLVFPTYYDTFGQVVLEAMACGLPVVVSAQAGVSEVVTDGQNAIVMKDPSDTAFLAEQLRMLQDPTLRERIGHAARDTAVRYTWDSVAERTLMEYEKITSANT